LPFGILDDRLQRLCRTEGDDDGSDRSDRIRHGADGDFVDRGQHEHEDIDGDNDHLNDYRDVVVEVEELTAAGRVSSGLPEITQALARLDAITRRLRVECPWDREQDERTIVPHTLEEAYELADAAHRRDDRRLLDELGDVLFQVHFLSLLLEERGAGDLAQVARGVTDKLIRRHPHVFGDTEVADAGEVRRNWDAIKLQEAAREPGVFGEIPENLPAPLYARKVQRRAASSGFDFADVEGPPPSLGELCELQASADADVRFDELGDVLFAAVNVARKLEVDPELALRAAADRFRSRVQDAVDLAASQGRSWNDLAPDQQLAYYAQARLNTRSADE
jgi:XTP/dITP diphosphohydrolase/tetrapyrrole methylase family protein/MazG family protein/ATP diphosphatase